MPKKDSEKTIEEIMEGFCRGLRVTIDRTYPIIDSDTNLAIPDMVGKHFEIEIDYQYFGERRIVRPISKYIHTLTFWDIEPKMSEGYAKKILKIYFSLNEKGFSESNVNLDELILGDEAYWRDCQKVHTLKAKGRVYCRK